LAVRDEIERLRRRPANVRPDELAALAKAAGWNTRRGGRHRWVFQKPEQPRPIVIPDHPGNLTPRIVRMVLNQIEAALEEE